MIIVPAQQPQARTVVETKLKLLLQLLQFRQARA